MGAGLPRCGLGASAGFYERAKRKLPSATTHTNDWLMRSCLFVLTESCLHQQFGVGMAAVWAVSGVCVGGGKWVREGSRKPRMFPSSHVNVTSRHPSRRA